MFLGHNDPVITRVQLTVNGSNKQSKSEYVFVTEKGVTKDLADPVHTDCASPSSSI
jgi:hypothetical protein